MKKGVTLFLLLAALLLAGCGSGQQKDQPKPDGPPAAQEGQAGGHAKEEPPGVPDPLTGLRVKQRLPLTAVLVDNLAPARPQSGLQRAGVVYEVEAEGRITRFLALYSGDPPALVGPVRSARPYFAVLALEWGAYLVHVGGSEDAYDRLAQWRVPRLDAMRGDSGFTRDKSRRAPHNTYVELASALQGREDGGKYRDWRFTGEAAASPAYTKISLRYYGNNRVGWQWSADRQAYLRTINGEPHRDRATGAQLAAANVLVLYVPHRDLRDKLEHIDVQLVGEGRAEFFLGGRYVEGSWEKKDLRSPMRFLDKDGKEFAFFAGPTWIQVVRPGTQVEKD